ncbi:flagellar hook assembly protein FlgD [Rheinheimera tangshanensis]|uniref:Basal-body rod modification protein FlgD n=1 Tax=Rheinheimera tangshanensis TaxID=400153 RepID=A0A5C8LXS3_9GAMM|nr:flagellar hook capping FlgD N-terminal domain-containing protein [Rheinheimera tangshanensis]TXK82081.1 LfgD [Rheinheimera tangshanensis]GGM51934.1 basal-body rod modification protein FlgD [Rheinheimera tangshanensis]
MSAVDNNSPVRTTTSSDQIASNGKTDAAGLSSMFLELLVAQISNQNPLNPMDGTEYVSQLAEFSSVESLENLNIQSGQQIKYMQSMQAMEATSLVGQKVDVKADTLSLEQDDTVEGAINLGAKVDSLVLRLYDSKGVLADEMTLDNPAIGTVRFAFPEQQAGAYSIQAEVQLNNSKQQVPTYLTNEVERVSVGTGPDDIILQVNGLGNHYLFDINQLSKTTQS